MSKVKEIIMVDANNIKEQLDALAGQSVTYVTYIKEYLRECTAADLLEVILLCVLGLAVFGVVVFGIFFYYTMRKGRKLGTSEQRVLPQTEKRKKKSSKT